MTFVWRDYQNIAKHLNSVALAPGCVNVEAAHRSSVSRHYYAMYHTASNYAVAKLGYVLPSTNIRHKSLKDFYLNYPDDKVRGISYKFLRDVGADLRSCLSLRVKADYHSSFNKAGRLNSQVAMRVERVLVLIS
jgi:hypothetical protein